MENSKLVACKFCTTDGLRWTFNFKSRRPMLIDQERQVHRCLRPPEEDISPGKCKFCKTTNLLWIRKENKWELTEEYGLPHTCQEVKIYNKDFMEAKRIDYAFEKARLNKIP